MCFWNIQGELKWLITDKRKPKGTEGLRYFKEATVFPLTMTNLTSLTIQGFKAELAYFEEKVEFRENCRFTRIAPSWTSELKLCFSWHILSTFLIEIQIYLTS